MPLHTIPLSQLGKGFDPLRLHELNARRYPYLLQSVLHGTAQSRYDILFAFPGQQIRWQPGLTDSFLAQLDRQWQRHKRVGQGSTVEAALPFRGGWFLYLAYELASEVEPTLRLSSAQDRFPAAFATAIPAALVVDHAEQQLHLVVEEGQEALLELMKEDLLSISTGAGPATTAAPKILRIDEDEPARYLAGVERIKKYILDGDVFQVNLSRGWQVSLGEEVSAAQLYRRLRQHNAAPFAALVCEGEGAIISSSPERLIDVKAGRISTRPIAGTRPRGNDDLADEAYSKTLLGHPKERAEHVMLIDLERNDLGRVCQPGSVSVDELMVLESYAHVHHIVSNVSGTLRAGVTPGQAIAAVFPGGTITGCPKVRCMEIIQSLEQTCRGPYTGSLGYLNYNGDMDLNILIRTMYKERQQLKFRTGAGIVADSIAENELQETRVKAKGLLSALGACGT